MGVSATSLAAFLFISCFICLCPELTMAQTAATGVTRHYKFDVSLKVTINWFHKLHLFEICFWLQIRMHNVTRLCKTKSIITVNGKFPGPRIIAREGDRLVIKVVNHVSNNISIHWYAFLSQFLKSWHNEQKLNLLIMSLWWGQAWNSTTSNWMGWWASIHNTMPNSNGPIICLQLYHHRTNRNTLVSCPCFMG